VDAGLAPVPGIIPWQLAIELFLLLLPLLLFQPSLLLLLVLEVGAAQFEVALVVVLDD